MKRLYPWEAVAGLAAMAVALGVAELVAGALQETSLFVIVGQYVIDHAPGGASRFAIDLFGENDKPSLVVTVIVVSLLIGGVAGVLGRSRFVAGAAVSAFAVVVLAADGSGVAALALCFFLSVFLAGASSLTVGFQSVDCCARAERERPPSTASAAKAPSAAGRAAKRWRWE